MKRRERQIFGRTSPYKNAINIGITERAAGKNMLHIILGILKVIGIILGVILLLLCAVLLSILFVPVRYRTEAAKETERTDIQLRLSWLLHALSVMLYADGKGQMRMTVRLFGVRLPLSGEKRRSGASKERKTEENTPSNVSKETEREAEEEIPEERGNARSFEMQEEKVQTDPSEGTDETWENDVAGASKERNDSFEIPEEKERNAFFELPEEKGRNNSFGMPDGTDTEDEERESVFEKIRLQLRSVCDKIKKVTQSLKSLWSRLIRLPERLRRTGRKLAALLHKPQEAAELARRYEIRENWSTVYGYLRFLWDHFRPRSISGYLHFGTGDPALTGQLTGVIYMVLPARAGGLEIMPEFDGAVFETHIICTGHIRFIHLLRVLVRGFRDKRLRRLIAAVRSGK